MKGASVMDERKKTILKAIVDDYVASAEPVASKALVKNHNLQLSSATIRNVMAELEEMGYLEKPHTSAGRMPSDKGYRAYVDNLLSVPPISQEDEKAIRDFLSVNVNKAQDLIERTVECLSNQTNFVSVALSPEYSDSSVEQIKIMMIEPGRAIVVLVLSAGVVHDRLIRIPAMLDEQQLNAIARSVERCLAGKKLDDITLVMISSAAEGTGLPDAIVNQVLYEAYIAIKQTEKIEVYIDGRHKLLQHPEFRDVERASRFYSVLRQTQMVAGYMRDIQQEEEAKHRAAILEQQDDTAEGELSVRKPAYMVRIGQEIDIDGMENASFITTTYRMGGQIAGQIGIIGPKRMNYGDMIAQISFVNKAMSAEARRHCGLPPEEEDDFAVTSFKVQD